MRKLILCYLQILVNHFGEVGIHALFDVVTRHIEATNALKASNDGGDSNETWWKIQEASIMTLSICKDIIVEKQQDGTLHFDFIRFLDTVVLGMLNDSGDYNHDKPLSSLPTDISEHYRLLCVL